MRLVAAFLFLLVQKSLLSTLQARSIPDTRERRGGGTEFTISKHKEIIQGYPISKHVKLWTICLGLNWWRYHGACAPMYVSMFLKEIIKHFISLCFLCPWMSGMYLSFLSTDSWWYVLFFHQFIGKRCAWSQKSDQLHHEIDSALGSQRLSKYR